MDRGQGMADCDAKLLQLHWLCMTLPLVIHSEPNPRQGVFVKTKAVQYFSNRSIV